MMREQLIDAIASAIMRGEETFKGVRLPSPQRGGTDYQRRSYARWEAARIVEQRPLEWTFQENKQ